MVRERQFTHEYSNRHYTMKLDACSIQHMQAKRCYKTYQVAKSTTATGFTYRVTKSVHKRATIGIL